MTDPETAIAVTNSCDIIAENRAVVSKVELGLPLNRQHNSHDAQHDSSTQRRLRSSSRIELTESKRPR